MKTKYLGEYYIDFLPYEDNEGELHAVLINIDDESDYYDYELFMRHSEIIEGIGEIHAVYVETNNSSIVLQLAYSGDGGKLWRIY